MYLSKRIYLMVDNSPAEFKELLLLLLMLLRQPVSWCWRSLVMTLGSSLGINAYRRKLEEVEWAMEPEGWKEGDGGGIARWLVTALADPICSSKAKWPFRNFLYWAYKTRLLLFLFLHSWNIGIHRRHVTLWQGGSLSWDNLWRDWQWRQQVLW